MTQTIASLSYDKFSIGGHLYEGSPSNLYDFELYINNNTITTKGYNILKNNNVTVKNNAMYFSHTNKSYLSLDPNILNDCTNFEIEIKFKPLKSSTSISDLLSIVKTLSNSTNELYLDISWSKNNIEGEISTTESSLAVNSISNNKLYDLCDPGDVNVFDDYLILKIYRYNSFFASYINGDYKKGYKSEGKVSAKSFLIGCKNDISSTTTINPNCDNSFEGYIEYIKIKNFKTTIEQQTIDYKNFSINKNGDLYIDSLTENYKEFAKKKSLYYLPDALSTDSDSELILKAIGDSSSYKTVENGTMTGSIKPTDIVDLTRSESKQAVKLTANNNSDFLWDWNLNGDGYLLPSWSNGFNKGVTNSDKGYHAKWVKEGPDGKLCLKFIDMNSFIGQKHRWLGMGRAFQTSSTSLLSSYKVGDKISVHFKAKALKKDSILRVGIYRTSKSLNKQDFGPQTKLINLTETWKEYIVDFIVDDDWNTEANCSLSFYGHLTSDFETTIWVSDIILSKNLEYNMTTEQLYNLNSLGIKFNLTKDIDMDWSKPWTICYWKKPLCSPSSKYSLDSLGSNISKNNEKGYVYIGSSNTDNKLVMRLNNSQYVKDIADREQKYFGNWVFVILKFDGNKLYGSIRGENVKNFELSMTTSSALPSSKDYFNSGYDYDLLLGGFDNTNMAGSIFKDLFIAKNSVITDEDLDYIYRSKINYKQGTLTSSININENL